MEKETIIKFGNENIEMKLWCVLFGCYKKLLYKKIYNKMYQFNDNSEMEILQLICTTYRGE